MALQKRYYHGKASELVTAIENFIGFDKETGLVLDGSREGIFLDSFENLSLAIAYFLLGNKEKAKDLLKGIINNIGLDSNEFIYNKKGKSKDEAKKVLPGENTIYLSNQILLSILYWLFEDKEKSKELLRKVDEIIGKFEFQSYKIYKHGVDQEYFYSFNNILIAISKFLFESKEESKKLVDDIVKICFDENNGLLKATPAEDIYFLLDNALLSTYYSISGNEKKAEKIIKLIEEEIGFDKETKLAYRGLRDDKVIRDFLTYNNSHLAIAYLSLAGMFI